MRRHFDNSSSSSDAELKTYVGFFENFDYGLRYRDVSVDLSRNDLKTGQFQGADLGNRGQNIDPQKNLGPLVDSSFDVDYDFAIAIKHDSIQSDDWVMDFHAMPESFWAPKISIMPYASDLENRIQSGMTMVARRAITVGRKWKLCSSKHFLLDIFKNI